MLDQPQVSVLMPAYNEEKFICPAIQSVLSQTYANLELIVVDNASTDRTRDMARLFDDPRVRLIAETEHVCATANFNRTLAHARGEFVKFLPADDILYPRCLEKQVAVFADPASAGIALVSCTRDIIDEKGRKVWRPLSWLKGRLTGRRAIRRYVRAGINIIGEPGVGLVRRSTLEAVGGMDNALPYVFDCDLWCRVLLTGDLYAIPEVLTAFRISKKSLSYRMLGTHALDTFRYFERMKTNPEFAVNGWDELIGKINAVVREIVRWGAYVYFLRK